MGCYIRVEGYRDLDGKFKDMYDLMKLCQKQKISYPAELCNYFFKKNDNYEDIEDMEDLGKKELEEAMKQVNIDNIIKGDLETDDGATIEVSKIPKDVKFIHVRLSC